MINMKGSTWPTGEERKGLRRLNSCLSWGLFVSRNTLFVYYCAFQSLPVLSEGGPTAPLPGLSRGSRSRSFRPAGASVEGGSWSAVPTPASALAGAYVKVPS